MTDRRGSASPHNDRPTQELWPPRGLVLVPNTLVDGTKTQSAGWAESRSYLDSCTTPGAWPHGGVARRRCSRGFGPEERRGGYKDGPKAGDVNPGAHRGREPRRCSGYGIEYLKNVVGQQEPGDHPHGADSAMNGLTADALASSYKRYESKEGENEGLAPCFVYATGGEQAKGNPRQEWAHHKEPTTQQRRNCAALIHIGLFTHSANASTWPLGGERLQVRMRVPDMRSVKLAETAMA